MFFTEYNRNICLKLITTHIDGCANPLRGLDGRGLYLHSLADIKSARTGLYYRTPYVPLGLRSAVIRHFNELIHTDINSIMERKYMPNNVLEGCQGGSAVPRTVLAPLTGPQVSVLGIYFSEFTGYLK